MIIRVTVAAQSRSVDLQPPTPPSIRVDFGPGVALTSERGSNSLLLTEARATRLDRVPAAPGSVAPVAGAICYGILYEMTSISEADCVIDSSYCRSIIHAVTSVTADFCITDVT